MKKTNERLGSADNRFPEVFLERFFAISRRRRHVPEGTLGGVDTEGRKHRPKRRRKFYCRQTLGSTCLTKGGPYAF